MTEVTELPRTEIQENSLHLDQSQILSAEEQKNAANAAELAWGTDQTFVNTRNIESQQTHRLIDALHNGKITPEQFAVIVGSRMAEKVITGEKDMITDLDNRQGGSRKTKEILALSARKGTHTTALMIDLDEFKATNDTLGHLAGDQALFAAADHIRGTVREYDHAFRWGGDEFFVVLPETGLEDAVNTVGRRLLLNASESIREAMKGMGYEIPKDITFSIGAAEDNPPQNPSNSNTEERELLLTELADKAARVSKFRGKNRLTVGMIIDGIEVFRDQATEDMFTAAFDEKGKITGISPYQK